MQAADRMSDYHKFMGEPASTECDVCSEELTDNNIFILTKCNHKLHLDCLILHLKAQIDDCKFPLICMQHTCRQELAVTDIEMLLSEDQFEKYEKVSFD